MSEERESSLVQAYERRAGRVGCDEYYDQIREDIRDVMLAEPDMSAEDRRGLRRVADQVEEGRARVRAARETLERYGPQRWPG